MTARPSVCVVANPTSGSGRGRRVTRQALAELARLDVRVLEVTGTTGRQALGQAQRAAVGADALLVVGGDGTAHLGAQVCAGTDLPLGVVPAGTGDDVARGLGMHGTDAAGAVRAAVAALREGRARQVDALRVSSTEPSPTGAGAGAGAGAAEWVLGVVSAGFDALVNERVTTWSTTRAGSRLPGGRVRYVLAVAREAAALRHPLPYDLQVDGEVEQRRALLVALACSPSFGGGMRIAPDARVDDGLLDVVVVDPLPLHEFARVFPRVFSGGHVRHPAVHVRRARSVRLGLAPGAERAVAAYGDGERLGPLPVDVEVVPGALRVLA